MVVMVMLVRRFFLNSPSKMKEIIHRTWKLERTIGMVAINIISLVKKTLEKWMVKIRDRYDKFLRARTTFFFFLQTHLNCKPSLLHFHLLILLHDFDNNWLALACSYFLWCSWRQNECETWVPKLREWTFIYIAILNKTLFFKYFFGCEGLK